MGDRSAIEWTDATWNPVRGCVKVSPGCKHCYAETFAERWRGVVGHAYEQGFDPRLAPEQIALPLRWTRPRRVFVNSMSDLFGAWVPDEYIAAAFGVMAAAPQHTFQILTKRARHLGKWFEWYEGSSGAGASPYAACYAAAELVRATEAYALDVAGPLRALAAALDRRWPLDNVLVGVSVEDRRYGLPRVEELRRARLVRPSLRTFLSIEPLLEDLGELDLSGIDWVIVGGESGPGAREMRPEWVRSLRDQCAAQSVPFFFKQWGGVRKKLAGRLLDGRTHDDQPRPPWA